MKEDLYNHLKGYFDMKMNTNKTLDKLNIPHEQFVASMKEKLISKINEKAYERIKG